MCNTRLLQYRYVVVGGGLIIACHTIAGHASRPAYNSQSLHLYHPTTVYGFCAQLHGTHTTGTYSNTQQVYLLLVLHNTREVWFMTTRTLLTTLMPGCVSQS